MPPKVNNLDWPAYIAIEATAGSKLRPLDDVIQDVIIHAIQFCHGNMTRAADELGMSRSSLYRKMAAYKQSPSQKQKERPQE